MRGEEADRVVAPVVHESALADRRLGAELVDGEQLDRGDAEVAQVVRDGGRREPGVRAAQLLGDAVVQLRHALDVQLVDDRVPPATLHRLVAAPVEPVVHDHALGDVRRGVGVVAIGRRPGVVPEDRGHRVELTADGACVGVEEQLRRVEAQPLLRRPRPGDPVAVAGADRDARDGAVPDAQGALGQPVPGLLAGLVEEADPGGVALGSPDREVRRLGRPRRPERVVAPRPDRRGLASGAPESGSHPGSLGSPGVQNAGHDRVSERVRPPRGRRRGRDPPPGPPEDERDQPAGAGRAAGRGGGGDRPRRRQGGRDLRRRAGVRGRQRREGDGRPRLRRHGEAGRVRAVRGHRGGRGSPSRSSPPSPATRWAAAASWRWPRTSGSPTRRPCSASRRSCSGSSPGPAAPSG